MKTTPEERLNILARKYNWFTADEDIAEISDYIKISYIYCHGNFFELAEVMCLFELDLLQKAYHQIEKDWFAFKERRKTTVEALLRAKEKGII
jgi:diphthamide synthase subunit DPH2